MSIPSWAHRGANVVAVGFRVPPGGEWAHLAYPVRRSVYTVRDIGLINPSVPDIVCVHLTELINPVERYKSGIYEVSFQISCFRPLVKRTQKEDIALFKSLLAPEGVFQDALLRMNLP